MDIKEDKEYLVPVNVRGKFVNMSFTQLKKNTVV